MTTMEKVKNHLLEIPAGRPFPSGAFFRHGSRCAVDQALCRLAKKGDIQRLAQGLYLKPKHSAVLGNLMPTDLEIAKAAVETEGARLAVPGAVWALKFGLTTQVMMQTTFLTDGPTRHVHLGQAVLTLRHAAPRTMRLAGTPAGRAILALEWLGEPACPGEAIGKIRKALTETEFQEFRLEVETRGGWIAETLKASIA